MIYDVSIYDISGLPLSHMVQWDFDRYIYIQDTDLSEAYPIHFFNIESDVAYVVESIFENDRLKAKIPNVLLTQPHTINGYIYVSENGENKSLYQFRIPIRKRPKPSDIIYEDTDDYIAITTAVTECKKYAEQMSNEINKAEQAAENAQTSAKAAEISAAEAEQNVAKALAEAKESGEFDGEPGASGVFVSETADAVPPENANVHIITEESDTIIPIPDSWERDGDNVYLLCENERIGDPIALKDGVDGKNFTIMGYYNTLDALYAAVPTPEPGDAYGIGTAAPYIAYVFDGVTKKWIDNGSMSGVAGVGIESVEQTTSSDDSGGENIITVTLTNNEATQFIVKNGQKGDSPRRGIDYWTDTDQQEIINAILANFIDASEVAL